MKSAAQWRSSLAAYANPVIGKLPLTDVTTDHVLEILRPIWSTKRETARRVQHRVARILRAAKAQGIVSGDNPADWRGKLEDLLPARDERHTRHHAALPYKDLPALMTRLRKLRSVSARALEFAILTCARTSEVIGATWSEVDLDDALWTVPASRMKSGRQHAVPLSDAALAVLAALPREPGNEHVFVGGRARGCLSNMALLECLRGLRADVTVHGFRSSFADWANEQTQHAHVVVEAALAHAVGDRTERAYRRGTAVGKRRQLMGDWSAFVGSG